MTKKECQNMIFMAVENAIKNGYKVVVASDEEGNSWNLLDPRYMAYGDTQKDYIAIGVVGYVDEETIFKPEVFKDTIQEIEITKNLTNKT